MKKSIGKMRLAFSLIELLISLIVISLLISAFAPIITKKLKASDITVGSFDSSNKTVGIITRQPNKEDCEKFNAIFIPKTLNDGIKNICVTKYNMGDNGLPLSQSTVPVAVGQDCPSNKRGYCCFTGATSPNCTDGEGDYSGCNRTVCQWKAANASCANYAPEGSKVGDWRLPTTAEFNGWKSNFQELTVSKGGEGLQLCSRYSSPGINTCEQGNTGGCKDADTNKRCIPCTLWGLDLTPYGNYSGEAYIRFDTWANNGNYGELGVMGNPQYYAQSVRCVLDSIIENINLDNNQGEEKDEQKGPQSQEDCDKIAPYLMFIEKKYNDGFHNVCVTKYNVGDSGGPGLGQGVIRGSSGKCGAQNCCWTGGRTSDACSGGSNGDSTYSGCNRAACQHKAGKISCESWAPNGKYKGYWRLPTKEELDGWALTINNYDLKGTPILTSNMGSKGLQFCAYNPNASTVGNNVQCYYGRYSCPGADYDYCHTANIYGEGNYVLGLGNPQNVLNATATYAGNTGGWAYSVRCVYDGLKQVESEES